MGNKIFGGVVLLLWGASMTWLVTAKILPPFFAGDAPITSLDSQLQPTGWRIELNGQPCGVAVSQAVPGTGDCTEIHSRVKLNKIPLPEVAPKWMSGLLAKVGKIDLDVRNSMTLDTFDNLATFVTKIKLNETSSLVRLSGAVQDDKLRLTLNSGSFSKETEYPWHYDRLLAGELMPDSRLEGLFVGKKWHKEIYTMFGSPNMPINMIEAEVVSCETLHIGGEVQPVYHIVYRPPSTTGVAASDRVQARLWVAEDGRVVRQEATFMNARLRFDRLTEDESAELAASTLELDRYATVPRSSAPRAATPQNSAPRASALSAHGRTNEAEQSRQASLPATAANP